MAVLRCLAMTLLPGAPCLLIVTALVSWTSSQTAPTTRGHRAVDVTGSWQSEDMGLDFPIWMVDTYSANGTALTEFFSKPQQEVKKGPKVMRRMYRITDGFLKIGEMRDGQFIVEGQPRQIVLDDHGKVRSIGGFKRVDRKTLPD